MRPPGSCLQEAGSHCKQHLSRTEKEPFPGEDRGPYGYLRVSPCETGPVKSAEKVGKGYRASTTGGVRLPTRVRKEGYADSTNRSHQAETKRIGKPAHHHCNIRPKPGTSRTGEAYRGREFFRVGELESEHPKLSGKAYQQALKPSHRFRACRTPCIRET